MRFRLVKNAKGLDSFQILGIIGVPVLLLARFFPFGDVHVPLCTFRYVTGIPCPTCGMTTCFVHLSHGEFYQALLSSPLGSLVFLLTVIAVIYLVGTLVFRWPAIRVEMSHRERIMFFVMLGVLLAANWVYNLVYLV